MVKKLLKNINIWYIITKCWGKKEVIYMIKLQCTKCGKSWYTTYVQGEQICSDCNGPLIEVEMECSRESIEEDKSSKKVSFFKSLLKKI
jgi:predicted amidophosphoribosyltransferase